MRSVITHEPQEEPWPDDVMSAMADLALAANGNGMCVAIGFAGLKADPNGAGTRISCRSMGSMPSADLPAHVLEHGIALHAIAAASLAKDVASSTAESGSAERLREAAAALLRASREHLFALGCDLEDPS